MAGQAMGSRRLQLQDHEEERNALRYKSHLLTTSLGSFSKPAAYTKQRRIETRVSFFINATRDDLRPHESAPWRIVFAKAGLREARIQ